MRRALLAAALLGSLAGQAPARAQTTQETAPAAARVRAMLSAYEGMPRRAELRALGDGALDALIALYDDRGERPWLRLRAVSAAGALPSDRCRSFLLRVAREDGQRDLFVRAAVLALGRAFGARAVGELSPFLASPHPLVREAAGQALGRVGTPEARRAVGRRLAVEPSAAVRRTLREALADSAR